MCFMCEDSNIYMTHTCIFKMISKFGLTIIVYIYLVIIDLE